MRRGPGALPRNSFLSILRLSQKVQTVQDVELVHVQFFLCRNLGFVIKVLNMSAISIPQAFIWRRLHSLAGLWLVIYLMDHLLINSQAALFFGDDGKGFIQAVNSIHQLPYLPIIEILVIGVPIAIHGIWGILYLRSAAYNSIATDSAKPALSEYPRNRAYTWQRITSWILLLGIVAHVVQMRFVEYPTHAVRDNQSYYIVKLEFDSGLTTLADRLGVTLLTHHEVQNMPVTNAAKEAGPFNLQEQKKEQQRGWVDALHHMPINETQVLAAAKNFGTAELLIVRETFKNPLMMVLYTLFVLAACYHAFNGLWTCLITWGVILTAASQKAMKKVSVALMVLVAFLGLVTIWCTYWINLKY